MTIDDQIKAWLKDKFLKSHNYYPATQGDPDDIEIVSVDKVWECGCYSEYTRDDNFTLVATMKGSGGREFVWAYGSWGDLPQFIEELDEYIYGNECPYAEDDN